MVPAKGDEMGEKMTVKEIAERWKMGPEWVEDLCRTGTLPAERTADGWLVSEAEVREYEARQYETRNLYNPDDANEPPESINPG
ncbi:MAG TPA: helix-turn-helix domain-containing protein [Aggregatilineales bacterium]|nr:helix-turn-helix domain-containing protein [Aggregatilineales bacterium]